MKVYVVYFVHESMGVQIVKIFDRQDKAELFIQNRSYWDSNKYEYIEEEVD